MINIGIIGAGRWGPNHLRVFSSLADCRVKTLVDLDEKRLTPLRQQFPSVEMSKNYLELLKDESVDAVVVSTPTDSHYQICKEALKAKKHVLCEKPLCTTTEEGVELIELAQDQKCVLMVGHVFLFNSGIESFHEIIKSGKIGNLQYIKATRTNLGPVRQDVNAAYDLATHDLSIFDLIIEDSPFEVSAVGLSALNPEVEDLSFISLRYPKNRLGHIHVSWLDPKKVREITAVGDKKMVTWDDLSTLGPVTLFDKGVEKREFVHDYGEFQLLAREGDISIPNINLREPLKNQDQHFLDCIKGKAVCKSPPEGGLKIVKMLEAINQSMREGGRPVELR